MSGKIKSFLSSSKLFPILIVIFVVQGLFFAASMEEGVPPDEGYHYNFIQYYSQQPVTSGPFINHQNPESLPLGDIQRTPSYLYHYVLGNFLRLSRHIVHSEIGQIYLLRCVNLILVVLGLLVLRKVFQELKVKVLHQNLVFLALIFTTMFVGISAAVNYDNAVFLVTNLSLLFLLRTKKHFSAVPLLGFLFTGLFGILIKETFVVIFFGELIAGLYFMRKDSVGPRKLFANIMADWKMRRPALIAVTIFTLVALGLAGERYGGNIVRYHALTPGCPKIHTRQECLQNRIFRRNDAQKRAFDKFKAEGNKLIYNPFGFSGDWISQMYGGLFFYLGHKSISPTDNIENLVAIYLLVSLVLFTTLYKRGSILHGPQEGAVIFVVLLYTAVLFLFNLNSYLNTGASFGFQGRYLIPALPFIYLLLARALHSTYSTTRPAALKFVRPAMIIAAAIILFNQFPLLVFYRGTDQRWYTDVSLRINTDVQKVLTKTHIAKKGSLPSVSGSY